MAGLPLRNREQLTPELLLGELLVTSLTLLSEARSVDSAKPAGAFFAIFEANPRPIKKYAILTARYDNSVIGHFQATGVRPRFLNDLLSMGIKIPGSYFDPSQQL